MRDPVKAANCRRTEAALRAIGIDYEVEYRPNEVSGTEPPGLGLGICVPRLWR